MFISQLQKLIHLEIWVKWLLKCQCLKHMKCKQVHRVLERQSWLLLLHPIHTLSSVTFLITHISCTETSVQGLGRALLALISVVHRVCCEYLNLCNFICILLNKVHYLLPKPFNQIFNFSHNF